MEREREYHGYDFMLSLMIGSWQCTVQVSKYGIVTAVFSLKKAKVDYALHSLNGLFCLSVAFRLTQEIFTHMEMTPLPVEGCKIKDLCLALMATEKLGFFSVPHLLSLGLR